MTWATLIPLALGWLKTNWQGLLAGAVMAGSLVALKGCQAETPSAVATVGVSQSLSGTAKASSGGSVKIPGRASMPCPPDKVCPECPSVQVDFGSTAAVSGGASQSVSASAAIGQSGQAFGLWVGAGAVDVLGSNVGAYGEIVGQYGKLAVPLRYDTMQRLSVGVAYQFR